jgi:hypothetical protein
MSSSSKKRLEANKAKRKATFQASEARKAPAEPILERNDLDGLIKQYVSESKQRQINQTLEWFKEFWLEGLDEPLGTEEQVEAIFAPRGPTLSMRIMRQYFLWIATSRTGLIQSSLSIYTMFTYVHRFFNTLEYYQIRPLEREVKDQLSWWVSDKLAPEASLHSHVRTKPVARMSDVTILLSTLYTDVSLCSFVNPRSVLYLNLFINLAIDSCGRIGEIACANKAPKEQCLKWEDIELWAKEGPEGKVLFYGILNFRWLKGKKRQEKDFKKVCLKLLDKQFMFEDSLRLLLYTALLEGHLTDFRTWEDLEGLTASTYGSKIRIKESSMTIPVLRSINWLGNIVMGPLSDQTLTKQLSRLGRMAGFREKFTR